eukprot:6181607-Pleurochrysis_carterae.AAC.1
MMRPTHLAGEGGAATPWKTWFPLAWCAVSCIACRCGGKRQKSSCTTAAAAEQLTSSKKAYCCCARIACGSVPRPSTLPVRARPTARPAKSTSSIRTNAAARCETCGVASARIAKSVGRMAKTPPPKAPSATPGSCTHIGSESHSSRRNAAGASICSALCAARRGARAAGEQGSKRFNVSDMVPSTGSAKHAGMTSIK